MSYTDIFSFYRSPEWETLRRNITLARVDSNGDLLCEHCHLPIVKQYDAICHHITALDESNVHDATIALNPDNIQVVHARCHNKIHERWGFQSSTRHINIVWGSPCAGKRAYVDGCAAKGDLIVDIDGLYGALGVGGDRTAVKTNVLSLYRALVDQVRTRNGRWRTAWIIRTLPFKIDRDNVSRELGGGELIHIDTDHDTCLMEAKRRGGDWVEWVETYWDRFQSPDD